MPVNSTSLILGSNLMLFASTGSTNQPFAFAKSAEFSSQTSEIPLAHKDAGNQKEILLGESSYSLKTDGLLNFVSTGTTQSTDEILKAYNCRCLFTWTMAVASGSTPSWSINTSKKYLTGCAFITSMSVSAGVNEIGTYSVDMTGTGGWTLT
jgi:hypothetical protein